LLLDYTYLTYLSRVAGTYLLTYLLALQRISRL
jgi:hypothetical protein